MKTEVETLNPTRIRLSVEVSYEELRPDVDSAYRRISEQVNIPGFRRGKVPARLIDQRFGRGTVLEEAVQGALPRFYGEAIKEAAVQVVGQPEVDITSVPDGGEDGELRFTAEVDVRPEIDLPEFTDLEVEIPDADADDPAVDRQLEQLRSRFGSLRTVERAAAAEDFLTLDLSATVDGEVLDQLSARGLSYQIGGVPLIDGLDEAVTGLSVDEERTFPTALAAGEYADKEAQVTVTLRAVRERDLPELDDDFAQSASEFDTMAELRDSVRERLQRALQVEQVRTARDKVLEAVLARVEIPLPESVVEAEIQGRQDSLNHQLEHAGMTKAQYLQSQNQSEGDFDAEVADGARNAVKAQLLLDALADREEFGVTEPELTEHLVRRAVDLNVPANELAQRVVQTNQVPVLLSEIRRAKALAMLVESAKVRDASGRPVDLSAAAAEEADAVAAGDVDEDSA